MKIYVGHASQGDYRNELYKPLMQSSLWQVHEWYLPHLASDKPFNSKALIESCDLLLAEVSLISTGLGIELGWAHSAGTPILAIHKTTAAVSSSVALICQEIISYDDFNQFLVILERKLQDAKASRVG